MEKLLLKKKKTFLSLLNIYILQKKLIEICGRKLFKRFSYLTNYKKKVFYEINCKENIEFHNSYTSNKEIISRVKE